MKALRILLADDDPDVRELVTLRAESAGYSVETVTNGDALVERSRAAPDEFDVIVTDNDMPGGIDGLIAIAILRADLRFRHLPLILHSNNSDPKLERSVENLEASFAKKCGTRGYDDLFAELAMIAKD